MGLLISGNEPASVFGLLGYTENSGTFALGWCLERCPTLMVEFVRAIFGDDVTVPITPLVELQKHGCDGGYTDIEIHAQGNFHLIFEAKRYWDLPSPGQLERYAARLQGHTGRASLVTLTSADRSFALRRLPTSVNGVQVTHISWGDVLHLAERARASASSIEQKVWLRHLETHIEDYAAVERVKENRVYVVSLSHERIDPEVDYRWIDVVEKHNSYFHPVGATWPVQPPNYIAFRYDGQLQSVHHVDSFEVVSEPSEANPLWNGADSDHFVYRLGPAMEPKKPMRTGSGIVRAARVWCAIDTLLSGQFETITEARDESNRRLDAARKGSDVPASVAQVPPSSDD